MYGSANAVYTNTEVCPGIVYVLVLPAASSPSINNLISLDPKILFIILDIDPPIVPNMEAVFCCQSSRSTLQRLVYVSFGGLEWAGLGWRVDRVCRRRRDANVVLTVEQVNHAIGKSRSIVWRLGEFSKFEGKG